MKIDVVTSRTAGYKSNLSAEISICKTVISTILRVVNTSGNGGVTDWYLYRFAQLYISVQENAY